jgi:hypothetical protein
LTILQVTVCLLLVLTVILQPGKNADPQSRGERGRGRDAPLTRDDLARLITDSFHCLPSHWQT